MTDPPGEYQGARSASRRTGALGPSERAVQTVGPAVFPPLEALLGDSLGAGSSKTRRGVR